MTSSLTLMLLLGTNSPTARPTTKIRLLMSLVFGSGSNWLLTWTIRSAFGTLCSS